MWRERKITFKINLLYYLTTTGMKCEICWKEFDWLQCHNKWCNQRYEKCPICWKVFMESDMYEYRGFHSCWDCHDLLQEKVNYKRKEVMEITNHSTLSQRNWEFVNNKNTKLASDWLPIMKIKEPQILIDYENWIL